MRACGKEEYKCNWENAKLGSWLAGPLPLPSSPGEEIAPPEIQTLRP